MTEVTSRLEALRSRLSAGTAPAAAKPETGEFPLTSAQRRLWFLEDLTPGLAMHHLPSVVRVRGPLDAVRMQRALDAVVRRHGALRTRVVADRDGVRQQAEQDARVTLAHTVLQDGPDAGERLDALVDEFVRTPFDLHRAPLMRAGLVRLGPDEHVLMFCFHHLVCDGWSIGVFWRDLSAAHDHGDQAFTRPPGRYSDFAANQSQSLAGEAADRGLAYWRETLAGAEGVLALPTDRPRPAEPGHRAGRRDIVLSQRTTHALRRLGTQEGASLFMVLAAVYSAFLHRQSGETDIRMGLPVAGRPGASYDDTVGFFANTTVLRTRPRSDMRFADLFRQVRDTALAAMEHQNTPFERIVEGLGPERALGHHPLFQVMFGFHNVPSAPPRMTGLDLEFLPSDNGIARYDIDLALAVEADEVRGDLTYDAELFTPVTARRMADRFVRLADQVAARPDLRLGEIDLLLDDERAVLTAANDTAKEVPQPLAHELFARQAARRPDAPAVTCLGTTLTYREVDERANRLAHHLVDLGAGPDRLVAVHLDRSADLLVALLAVWKAGAAYLPLDPSYPAERLGYMITESGTRLMVTTGPLLRTLGDRAVTAVCLDRDLDAVRERPAHAPVTSVRPDNLAYTIFTSGSTGRPKGVMVQHGNVRNLFTALDDTVPDGTPGRRWLAVTSVAFDISVLELFWTLSQGYEVVLRAGDHRSRGAGDGRDQLDFSLFYFGDDTGEPGYELLLEGAKFADRNGFRAVWTPERHFHEFGGRYPNPAITSAAVASVTDRIGIRAGSVVLPLHDPLRVAEAWSVVDNLSAGRVGLSFASGWHPQDFALAPEAFADRRRILRESIDQVRALWRGEQVPRRIGTGETLELGSRPAAVQEELPVWITTGGTRRTFELAGELGANLLTHLLGQSTAELRDNIAAYRAARAAHGHDPAAGTVTLMLHTFVCDPDEDPQTLLREPFRRYLRTSFGLMGNLLALLGKDPAGADGLTEADTEFLLDQAFDRFFLDSGLIGTRTVCTERAASLFEAGVDELACLVDLGLDTPTMMRGLEGLSDVMALARSAVRRSTEEKFDDLLKSLGVSHTQMTPSMAAMLDPGALTGTETVLIGGEEFPRPLGERLRTETRSVINMYGPTETTVWSATHPLDGAQGPVPIGRPIANTQIHVLDESGTAAPPGVAGEICIGGLGVTRGYLHRPELTAERYVPDPFGGPGSRMYRTGDRGVRAADGTLRFLGRIDDQVKVRGFRIEPREVEQQLLCLPGVREAAVVKEGDGLVGYLAADTDTPLDEPALLARLRTRLPDYMVPGTLIRLDALPRTPNGKLDRSSLPARSARPQAADSAPRGAVEQGLAEIWCEVLERESVGVRQSFFELGGHSLRAMQAVGAIRRRFGVPIPLRSLFEAPTIAGLARMIELGTFVTATSLTPDELAADSEQVAGLAPQWRGTPAERPADVLLTGATGFLGRVLLHELLASGVETVRCLVLAADTETGRGDIEGALRTAGLWNPDFADRIVPVPGNLGEPRLGLSQEEFSDLAERVDAVYHAGALVHMLYPYALLKPANVDGTAEALRLACLGRPKTFHHVSSLDVFPDGVPHSEEHVPADAKGLTGAYAQSKWVAEAMVRALSRRGLPVTIYRPANVAGDTRTGYWNTNDATYTLLRGCLALGAAPDLDVTLALTPVDYAARAIVELSRQPSRGQAYHLYNPHPALPWRAALAALAELGHPLELLPYQAWRSRGLEAEESAEQLGRMLALNAEFSGEAEAAAGQARSRTIVVSCAATVEALAGTPVRCPPVDAGFLAPFIDRWARQGLTPASPDNTGDK